MRIEHTSPLANPLFASSAIGVTQLKRNPSAVIREAASNPIAILQYNSPAAYLVSAARYEAMMDVLDDLALKPLILERQRELSSAVAVDIDALELSAQTELDASRHSSRARIKA